MICKITPVAELKQIFLEILLSKTQKVNDISSESILNGIAYGNGKMAQKILMNLSLVEAHIFPDTAYGQYLDNLAKIRGISGRLGATGSSTYVRIFAKEDTIYQSDVHTFLSTEGIEFKLSNDVTIGESGFAFARVYSTSVGEKTNISPLSINRVNPNPIGHENVINEFAAFGGRDEEDDDTFRNRIKYSFNMLSMNTMAYIEQILIRFNERVLKIFKGETTGDNQTIMYILSVNGVDFTQVELDEMQSKIAPYLSISTVLRTNTSYPILFKNVEWFDIDVDLRLSYNSEYSLEDIRKNMQVSMNKILDYSNMSLGSRVEWDDLFYVAKTTDGVTYIPDTYFFPNTDIKTSQYSLPRIKSFILRDVDGNIIFENEEYSEYYIPNTIDEDFVESYI